MDVRVPESDPLGVGVPDSVPLSEGVPVGVAPLERDGVGDPLLLGVLEGLRLPVGEREGVALSLGVAEVVPVIDRVGDTVGVVDKEEPADAVPVTVPLKDGVRVREVVPLAVIEGVLDCEGVPVREPVGSPEGDIEGVPVRDPDFDGVLERVCEALSEPDRLGVGVAETDEPEEREEVAEGVTEVVLDGDCVAVPDRLRVPDFVPDTVPVCEEPCDAVPVTEVV